jgi:hypothetical protein
MASKTKSAGSVGVVYEYDTSIDFGDDVGLGTVFGDLGDLGVANPSEPRRSRWRNPNSTETPRDSRLVIEFGLADCRLIRIH